MTPPGRGSLQPLAGLAAFAAGYGLLQELGLALAFPPVGVAAFWPATGLAVWVLWRAPRRAWPAYLTVLAVLNVAGNLAHGNPLALSLGFVLPNLLEPVLAAVLLGRLAAAGTSSASPAWVLHGLLPAAIVPPAAGGVLGATAVVLLGSGVGAGWSTVWWTWFSADALGILAPLPALEALRGLWRRRRLSWRRAPEALAIVLLQVAVYTQVFGQAAERAGWHWPFLLLPGMLWAATRLGTGLASWLGAATTTGVVWASGQGSGPFATVPDVGERALAVQGYCVVLLLTAVVLGRVTASRERAEALLRQRSWAMENAVEGISFIGTDGRYRTVNPAYAATLRTTVVDLVGESWVPTVHPADLPLAEAAHGEMLAHGKGVAVVRGVRRDGTRFRKEITLIAERDHDGVLQGHHCFMRDVTERESLTEQLDQLFMLSPELLCVLDTDGTFRRLNPAWTRVLGHPVEELLGQSFGGFVHPDDLERTVAEAQRVMADGGSSAFENRYRRRDGTYCWLQWNSAVDREGTLIYAVAHDVTAAKETERVLAEARDRALEASHLKSQFLATMSHEIRTPMNGVIGLGDLLAETVLDPAQQRYVDGIRRAANALLGVINDILDFSKIEAGKFVLDDVDFDLGEVVEDAVSLSQQTAARKGLRLDLERDPDLPTALRGDPTRLRQVAVNLVGNAVKFTERGSVTVRVLRCGSCAAPARGRDPNTTVVCLEVRDTGVGMTAETVDRLFRPFTQADASTTRVYGGTGLGLAISHQLVEAMQGTITVDSEPGVGTTFRVNVPLRPATSAAGEHAEDPDALQILVVDGNETNRLLLQSQIQSWGMQAEAADGPAAAVDVLRRAAAYARRYDVAIVDMGLPGTTGLELAEAIAAHAGIPSLPVILLTSGEDVDEAEARRAGVSVTLRTPVTRSMLYDALVTATVLDGPQDGEDVPHGRVLLVEDNEINQTVATGVLTRLGYTVDVAADGLEALDRAAERDYQAILMDCQMPRMDGYTATRRLRAVPETAKVPIIAMTANALKEDRDRCIAAGMDDYLAKPVRPHDVESTLRRWLGTASSRSDGTRASGAFAGTTRAPSSERAPDAEPVPGADQAPDSVGGAGSTDGSVRERLDELAGDRTVEELALVQQLAQSFLRRVPGMLDDLDDALGRGDWPAVVERAHSLKGAAANLGARALADACGDVELLAGSDEAPRVPRQRDRLVAAVDEALAEVARGAESLG